MKDTPRKYTQEIEDLINKFNKLQEDRVKTYRKFEQGNRDYLNTGPDYDFISYRNVVNEVTLEFKSISEEIIAVEKSIRDAAIIDVADIIAAIQDFEREKLELTVEHHLSRQMVADSDGKELEVQTERDIRKKLGKVVEEINDNLTELRYTVYDES